MTQINLYKPSFIDQYDSWRVAKELYDKHIIADPNYAPTERIPKIIHHIWLGSPLPATCKKLRETWMQQHPHWQFMLWTDKEVEEFGLINQERYNASNNYGEKSDIVRYEILERFGGLYVDTDFECLQPFDALHHYCDFYAGVGCEPVLVVFNGLIASRPGHPILKECINHLKNHPSTTSDILERTGPFFFTNRILGLLAHYADKIVLFPTTYFYPWPHYERFHNSREEIESWIKPETLAIHHWHVSWDESKKR
jgi:mannosyltransferase OCH1-like enzyme